MPTTAVLNCLRVSPAPVPALVARLALISGLLVALAGCSSAPKTASTSAPKTTGTSAPALAMDVLPKVEPKSRYGNMGTYVVLGKRYYTKASSRNHVERGQASWYGKKFHGRRTSSGERYDMHQMTAAHKSLPLPTYALVTNLENGRSAVVKVNDRGPFVGNRIIDLSYAAAKRLDIVNAGTAQVEVRSIDPRDHGKGAKELLRLASADVGRQQRAKPSSAVVTRDGGPIFLQVGAFGSRGNAEQLQSRLARRVEEPVLVRAAAVGGASTPLYKVQVGPIRSRTDADVLGRRLAALGIDKPVLVVR